MKMVAASVLSLFLLGITCSAQSTKNVSLHRKVTRSSAMQVSAKTKKKGKKKKGNWKTQGQQKIDSERTRQIQEALVREHYLNGEPSGTWDTDTEEAMRRFQADQGWQDKMTPDSRALIKLGLGPDHDHLLNPETAMTSPAPITLRNTPSSTSVGAVSSSALPSSSTPAVTSQPGDSAPK